MPRHGDPDAQKAWDDLYKLIRLCPDPEGWGFREKLEQASESFGKAMYDWGRTDGWSLAANYEDDARDARDG